jgi:hypothetical protein
MINPNHFAIAALAGKAQLTITNPATGQWIKIKMKRRKDRTTGQPSNCYFMSLALLGDGEIGYRYVGAFFSDTNRFKRAANISDREIQITDWLVRALANPASLRNTEIQHAGACCKCGRKLTHPESIESGFGPECFQSTYGPGTLGLRVLSQFGFLPPA